MNVQHSSLAETAMPESKSQRSITKSELIEALASRQTHLAFADVELAVRNVIEQMSSALAGGDRAFPGIRRRNPALGERRPGSPP